MIPSWSVLLLAMAPSSTAGAAEPVEGEDAVVGADAAEPEPSREPELQSAVVPATNPATATTTATEPTTVTTAPTAAATTTTAPTNEAPSTTTSPEPETDAPATHEDAAGAEADEATPGRARKPYHYPKLMIAGGPLIGPHAIGNEECNSELAQCETKGSFFGVGAQLEVRGRIWKPLFIHLRGLATRNVSPNDRIYSSVLGAGAGLGAYHRRIFGRAEYVYLHALGDNRFEPPFFEGQVASDEWGHSAGTIAIGFRQPLPKHLVAELWGGVMLGPSSVRTVPSAEPERRRLTTFQVGLNLAWDAWR